MRYSATEKFQGKTYLEASNKNVVLRVAIPFIQDFEASII